MWRTFSQLNILCDSIVIFIFLTINYYTLYNSCLKVHLTPPMYLLFEILLRKSVLIRINPRFFVPRRNLENSFKTPPFCCTTESEENGSRSWCDVYPGRSNISRPLISLRMMQNIFEKVRRNAFQRCYRLLQQYPRFKDG